MSFKLFPFKSYVLGMTFCYTQCYIKYNSDTEFRIEYLRHFIFIFVKEFFK